MDKIGVLTGFSPLWAFNPMKMQRVVVPRNLSGGQVTEVFSYDCPRIPDVPGLSAVHTRQSLVSRKTERSFATSVPIQVETTAHWISEIPK